ncbi:MAG: aspartate/glutamate racemase family protein [Planctomycetota bacterium]
MKTIGLIGGMSWESSREYYRIINEFVRARLGGLHSARIVMHSFDMAEIAALQQEGDWEAAAKLMIAVAQMLEKAGANFLVICTNTMHKVADEVQKDIRIPLLHIADATAEEIKARGLHKVGLLGTKFTMEEDFYKDRLAGRHGLEVIVPQMQQRQVINSVIYDELCCGQVTQFSRDLFCGIIENLAANGAEGIILGCTEIHMLVGSGAPEVVPLFDTMEIHAACAAQWALE